MTLLTVAFWVGAVVDLGAAVMMAWPSAFWAKYRYRDGFDYRDRGFVYGMRFGAPLMLGWTVLLLWGAAAPDERRGLLLITIVPGIAGLALVDAWASWSGILKPVMAWGTRVLQLAIVALFAFAYFAG
ncbi:MAG: hypothetical protein U0904_00240 [Candidatus Nanopelagicales bacterium]|nr:hypothetical protein [Candidatus Nanopelagicales bacterium]